MPRGISGPAKGTRIGAKAGGKDGPTRGVYKEGSFLNGRIDLTQAEAVVDLIRSKTMASLESANQQLKGMLHEEIGTLKESLIQHLTLIEAHIDFPEEDLDPIFQETMEKDLQRMIERVSELISTHEEGKIFREGVSCAIIGKTNVGKSSLLNILLREDRAIVTPIRQLLSLVAG